MASATVWYEMIMLMVMLIMGATSLSTVVYCMDKPIISQTSEKTALDSFDIDNIQGQKRYGRDLLASLVNTDESAPYPNAIKIDNSPILKIDSAFHTKKFSIIGRVYLAGGDYSLSTKLDKEIRAMRFEVVNGVDVMHYYIDMSPPN